MMLVAAAGAEKPSELESLRAGWQEARKRALDTVDRKYLTALESLKSRLTKAGNLDAAVSVGKEIESVSLLFAEADMGGKRIDSRWQWGSGGTLTLLSDGKARHSSWSGYGSWAKLKNGNLVIQSDNGTAFFAVIDSAGNGKIRSLDGGGTTTIVKK